MRKWAGWGKGLEVGRTMGEGRGGWVQNLDVFKHKTKEGKTSKNPQSQQNMLLFNAICYNFYKSETLLVPCGKTSKNATTRVFLKPVSIE